MTKASEVSQIIFRNAMPICGLWDAWYERDSKDFINYLMTSQGAYLIASTIVAAHKYKGEGYCCSGAWEEAKLIADMDGKDFAAYVAKFNLPERKATTIADMLVILYAHKKETTKRPANV
jgi:hypothetical protein